MIPIATLRRAAREALAYVSAQPDVREAEAFAAGNGSLFARLSYTSHIPSNGVEEPKARESTASDCGSPFAPSAASSWASGPSPATSPSRESTGPWRRPAWRPSPTPISSHCRVQRASGAP